MPTTEQELKVKLITNTTKGGASYTVQATQGQEIVTLMVGNQALPLAGQSDIQDLLNAITKANMWRTEFPSTTNVAEA